MKIKHGEIELKESITEQVLFFFKIYLFTFGGGTEAEGERESQADSLPITEPDVGLDPRTLIL